MNPSVILKRLDNQLGIRPPTGGDRLAVIGPAPAGDKNVPVTFTKAGNAAATYTRGPLVEGLAYGIERYGNPMVGVRSDTSTAAGFGALDTTQFAGTSVPSIDGTTAADDEFECYAVFTVGCTIGVAGGQYQWSLDGGRTLSPPTALATDNFIIFPDSGGVRVNFGAGTVTAGAVLRFRAWPKWSQAAEIAAAFDALKATKIPWDGVLVLSPLGAAEVSTIAAKLAELETSLGKEVWAIGNVRQPNEGESEAAYRTAMQAALTASVATKLALCGAYAKTDSSISRRSYRRPVALSVAPLAASVSEEIDIAQLDLGPIPGVRLQDANGNPDDHDELIYPGLDDLRLLTLKSDVDTEGAFVTNPRMLAPTGSDYVFLQLVRVMNIACRETRAYLKRRLSKDLRVDKKTGFIFEEDAKEIEAGANARLRRMLLRKPKASAAGFVLSRNDDILSTFTLHYQTRVVPLGYSKFFEGDAAFVNPALSLVKV